MRSPASRIAFSAYAWRRSRRSGAVAPPAGQAPTTACHSRLPNPGSGTGESASRRVSVCSHSPGTSASTVIRARVSSPRLVSWVVSVVIACGQSACRVVIASWNAVGVTAQVAGSAPTSLCEVSRENR